MKKLKKSLILLFSILPFVPAVSAPSENQKNILILFAFDPSTPPYHLITDGIRQELTDAYGDAFALHTEYLSISKYPVHNYPKEQFELYNRKYKNVNLDLLILVGVDIMNTIENFVDDHLRNLPAITIDYDLSKYGFPFDMSLNNSTTEIYLKLDIERTLKKALDFFSGTKSLFFISGTSRIDSLYLRISMEAARHFEDKYKVTFITGRSMDEVITLVRKMPANSLIFVAGFNTDNNGVPYYTQEAVRLISGSANVPVFTYTDIGFGDGSFGGDILSFKKVGKIAGLSARRILSGELTPAIRISEQDYYESVLDWRLVKKWENLVTWKPPGGYTVLYRDESFFRRYWWYFGLALVFLAIQSIMIIRLIKYNRMQKQMTRQLIETDRRHQDIIREDRVLRMGMLNASLSHELNQPLTAILSTAQAGKRFLDGNSTDLALYRELFDNIVEDNNRAASILKSIRGMMKLEKREKEKVNLNILIQEVADLYRSKAIEFSYRLVLNMPDSPVYVTADAIQIQQVMLNLISNAAQAMERRQKNINIINVTEVVEDGRVTVTVRDYGPGIDDTVQKRLFEPFVTSRKEGIGIGLSVSRLIIEDHQGKISARNMPDSGAEFSFSLNLADES